MNGEGDFTCSVSIPGNISAATVHLPNANYPTDVHLPLIGIGTGDAFWEVPGTTDRDDAPVGFGYPPPPHTLCFRCVRASRVYPSQVVFEAEGWVPESRVADLRRSRTHQPRLGHAYITPRPRLDQRARALATLGAHFVHP